MDVADRVNLECLSCEIDRNVTYHNYKEIIGWKATAFYIPGIIISGHYAGLFICFSPSISTAVSTFVILLWVPGYG
jgi:hypothetical protein